MPSRLITVARHAALLLALLLAPRPSTAQLPASVQSTLHRIFASREFASAPGLATRWISGDAYAVLAPSTADPALGRDIVRIDAASGARTVLVSARALRPAGAATALDIADYAFSDDTARVLIFTNTERVWRTNSRGDYWVLDRRTGALRQLGGADARPSTLMFAKFSPGAGDRVAYVRDGDLWVEGTSDGVVTRLTSDASVKRVNGMTDWVYEEEFGLADGFRWSPDGATLAYWQFDMTGIRDFLLINNTDSLYSFVTPVQYPKAGTTNSAVRIGIVSAAGGATRWLDVPGSPRDDYLPRIEWAGPRQLIVQHVDRRQHQDDVLLADATTGAARTLFTERDSAWVEINHELHWLDGGRSFIWVSERDGWRHAYAASLAGGEPRLLTPGDYDLINVAGVDERGGWLYVIASPTNATRRALYRVSLRRPGPPERVTPIETGTHSYSLAPGARFAIHTSSSFDEAPRSELVALPSHKVARAINANDRLRAAVAAFVPRPATFFKVPVGGGVTLDGWMIVPRDFDSTRTYPVLVQVYSEPASQTVLDAWGGAGRLWHHMIADLGYVVISVDNRGTPAPKGRAWRKVIYGSIGPLSSREQAEAVRALTRTHSYLDSTRVAIWGWSGGGSATLNAMFRYPDVYRVGMAVAPVADERLYDTIYQERYLGLPQENAEGYLAGSPISFAEGLAGKLLVVHGTGDDNVHYQGTERLINRLVELGKPVDVMVYPNRSHCICEGPGTTLHVYSLLTRYLLTNLPPNGSAVRQ